MIYSHDFVSGGFHHKSISPFEKIIFAIIENISIPNIYLLFCKRFEGGRKQTFNLLEHLCLKCSCYKCIM